MIEKWKDIRDLVFFSYIFGMEDRKVERLKTHLFGWEENVRIKNKVGIGLPLCPFYIKQKVTHYIFNKK